MLDSVLNSRWVGGAQFTVQNFEKRGVKKKMSAWRDLKMPCHGYLPGEGTMFLVKKRILEIKYGFEGLISNVDLGLFQPNIQLMFSFVKFWFC